MENKQPPPAPDFAIFQNSGTRRSAIWTKELGRWHECNKEEFPAVLLIATMLRNSPEPEHTMKHIMSLLPPLKGGPPDSSIEVS